MLYGLALLFTFLPTELAFMQRILGTTSLTTDQWMIGIGVALALLLVDEVFKFFLRRSREPRRDSSCRRSAGQSIGVGPLSTMF